MSGTAKGAARGGHPEVPTSMLLILNAVAARYEEHIEGGAGEGFGRTADYFLLALFTVYERLVLGDESCAALKCAEADAAARGAAFNSRPVVLTVARMIEATARAGFEKWRRHKAGGEEGARRRWHGAGSTAALPAPSGAGSTAEDADGADALEVLNGKPCF